MARFPLKRGLSPLLLAAVGAAGWQFGLGLQRAIYGNFLVEVHGIQPAQLGTLESLREVPGLLLIVLVALVASLSPALVSALSCLTIGAALILYPFARGLADLVGVSLVFSVGFHLILASQSALVLHHAGEKKKGTWLGRVESVGAAASLLATTLAAVLVSRLGFRGLFFLAGAVAIAGGVAFLPAGGPRRLTPARQGSISRKYLGFYVVNLLQGARRLFFLVFAVYNLVEGHGVPTATVATLLAVSGLGAVLMRSAFGWLADRFGETKVLAASYAAVGLILAGYAFVQNLTVLYLLFALDSLLNFDLVITLFAYRLSGGQAVASAIAGGQTAGHVAAVTFPVLGGLLWACAGPRATFLAGVAVCAVAAAYSLWLDRSTRGVQMTFDA